MLRMGVHARVVILLEVRLAFLSQFSTGSLVKGLINWGRFLLDDLRTTLRAVVPLKSLLPMLPEDLLLVVDDLLLEIRPLRLESLWFRFKITSFRTFTQFLALFLSYLYLRAGIMCSILEKEIHIIYVG